MLVDNIHNEIINLIITKCQEIASSVKTGDWKKFIGDYFVRVIKYYIGKEIPNNYMMSEPNAYISGIPIEYDLLIIDKNAYPDKFTYSFNPSLVFLGLELKMHGIFGGRDELERTISKVKKNFDSVRNIHNHINFIYLTFKEVTNPVRENSIDYLAETKKYLSPYKVFCLSESRRGKIIEGQWQKFIDEVNRSLGA